MKLKTITFISLLGIILSTQPFATTQTSLQGAGATYPYPLYIKMFDEYRKKTQVKVNYQGIGSGGGIRQLKAKTVDFGATDAFITDPYINKHFKTDILHIPICSGGVAITFNLNNIKSINLTADVLSSIYQGKILYWNNPKITALNPDITLPKLRITPVFRADSSGTTLIFTDYLSKTSPSWQKKYGSGKTIRSRIGISGKGNAGVASLIKQIKGSIGYVGTVYAIQNKMPVTSIQNKAKNFITPNLESITNAVENNIPSDSRTSISNTSNPKGYPIAGLTWLIIYKNQAYKKRTQQDYLDLKQLLTWMISDGQNYAADLSYAPLSKNLQKIAHDIIDKMEYTPSEEDS